MLDESGMTSASFMVRRNLCSRGVLSCHRIASPRNPGKQTLNLISKKLLKNQYINTGS
jgi:hypothetical protein